MSQWANEAVSRFAEEVLANRLTPEKYELEHSTAQFVGINPLKPCILDVGAGKGDHALEFARMGFSVECCDWAAGCDYMTLAVRPGNFQGIWCSHTLEHMLDVQACLHKMVHELAENGVLCITVPPMKDQIVGGHVSLWNAGLLIYRLVLAGLDCSQARVGTYGYNISVIVKKRLFDMPDLSMDHGDLERLAPYFPLEISGPFNGRLKNIRW